MSNRLNTLYNTFIFKTIPSLAFKNGNWWLKRSLIHSCNNSTPRLEYISSREFCATLLKILNYYLIKNATPQFFRWDLFSFLEQILFIRYFLSFSLSVSPSFSQSCNWLSLFDNAHNSSTYLVTSIFHGPLSVSRAYENNFMIDCCLEYFHIVCRACMRDNI